MKTLAWQQYEQGVDYKTRIGLYSTVDLSNLIKDDINVIVKWRVLSPEFILCHVIIRFNYNVT